MGNQNSLYLPRNLENKENANHIIQRRKTTRIAHS